MSKSRHYSNTLTETTLTETLFAETLYLRSPLHKPVYMGENITAINSNINFRSMLVHYEGVKGNVRLLVVHGMNVSPPFTKRSHYKISLATLSISVLPFPILMVVSYDQFGSYYGCALKMRVRYKTQAPEVIRGNPHVLCAI